MSWSDTPVEIVTEIIFNLKDSRAALSSCSQTCKTLLPICRQHIFHTIHLDSQSDKISSFGGILCRGPEIADYVRVLSFKLHASDLGGDVSRVLNKLEKISEFTLLGPRAHDDWEDFDESLKQSILHIIHSPSLKSLILGLSVDKFPFSTFIHCTNLTSIFLLYGPITPLIEQQDVATGRKGPQLIKFNYLGHTGDTVLDLFHSRVPGEVAIPIIDFSCLRDLGCTITDSFDTAAAAEILGHSEKLEVLCATSMSLLCIRTKFMFTFITVQDASPGLRGLSHWLNPLSRITLKKLNISFILKNENRDPFQGHCEELKSLAGIVALEDITVDCVIIDSKPSRKLGRSKEWSRLSEVLRNGFPELKRFSMDIKVVIMAAPIPRDVKKLITALETLPDRQLRWLSRHSDMKFHFSVILKRVDSTGEEEEFLSSFEVGLS